MIKSKLNQNHLRLRKAMKNWIKTIIALTEVIYAEYKNESSVYRQPILDESLFNAYMSYASGYRSYGGSCDRYDGRYRFFDYFGTYHGYNDNAKPIEPPQWFIQMIDKQKDFYFATTVLYTAIKLNRKWTDALIKKYLPEPDYESFLYGGNGQTRKVYNLSTIEAIEATPEFQSDWAVLQDKRQKRLAKLNQVTQQP